MTAHLLHRGAGRTDSGLGFRADWQGAAMDGLGKLVQVRGQAAVAESRQDLAQGLVVLNGAAVRAARGRGHQTGEYECMQPRAGAQRRHLAVDVPLTSAARSKAGAYLPLSPVKRSP